MCQRMPPNSPNLFGISSTKCLSSLHRGLFLELHGFLCPFFYNILYLPFKLALKCSNFVSFHSQRKLGLWQRRPQYAAVRETVLACVCEFCTRLAPVSE